jgi:hypothetical protein
MMQERFGTGRHRLSVGVNAGVMAPGTYDRLALDQSRSPISAREEADGWAASFEHAMSSLGAKVNDYLGVLRKADAKLSRAKLTLYYEGGATIDEVALVFYEALPTLADSCSPLVISTLRGGTLRLCRQANPRKDGLEPCATVNEHWVQAPRYRVPLEAVVHSRLGWRRVANTRNAG